MLQCFVIQPFDGGAFDKRFDDVLTPSVEASGLKAYRVDRDPAVVVPITAIESGIRDAAACIADISTDNPNVWFELGYAMACNKPLVLICSHTRDTKFPFDVQHRYIVRYKTESPRDFQDLAQEITKRLKSAIAQEGKVQALAESALTNTEGLEPQEIAALVIIAQSDLDPESAPSSYRLKQDMERAGFTELAAVLAVKSLQLKKFVRTQETSGGFNQDSYLGFMLTEPGTSWLLTNRARLALRTPPETREVEDDDLPF
jgi:hypothetical protein